MKNSIKHFSGIAMAFMIAAMGIFVSCAGSGDDTIILETGNNSGIPSDELAGENPEIVTSTTYIPNINYTVEGEDDDAIVRIDMTGIQNPETYDWLRLIGTGERGQNVWVSVDGKPKGIAVYNNADDNNEKQRLTCDLVFVVDNSGSMDDEANTVL